MADNDALNELANANVAEYMAVKVLVGPAVLEVLVSQYERYRYFQLRDLRQFMSFTEFINARLVSGAAHYEPCLQDAEEAMRKIETENQPNKERQGL